MKTKSNMFENKAFNIQATPFELKAVSDTGEFEGYASVFNVVDQGYDVITPGAFTKSIETHKANGTVPAMLFGHGGAMGQSDMPIGVWKELREDDHGLFVKGQLILAVQSAAEVHALMKAEALDGMSIGYQVLDRDYTEAGVRILKQIAVHEISVVPLPMNEQARVTAVKSFEHGHIPDKRVLERTLRDVGMSHSQAKSFLSGGYSALRDEGDQGTHDALKTLLEKFK